MYFFYPSWLRHGRPDTTTSIFSVDIQPFGSRVATAGQDCAVKIWHLPAIATNAKSFASFTAGKPDPAYRNGAHVIDRSDDSGSSTTPPPGALLATITSHAAAVNVVRWSPSGSLLASAGDDHVVLLYNLLPGAAAPAFGDRTALENWNIRRPLRSHTSDVTDLAWSPDGERLASASVDNSIIVWNLRAEMPLIRLDGHKGLVKGLAWDPVGRFLASQSDDRTLRIWRTSDWKTEKVISKPFETAVWAENSLTFFLRISWAPCGTHLLATNAYRNKGHHHAPMFSRANDFDNNPIEFFGHKEPIISSRFSSRLYRSHPTKVAQVIKETEEENRKNQHKPDFVKKTVPASVTNGSVYTVLALGSKDGGCSVWQATGIEPFFSMYDVFDMEVIDISWASDGYSMTACSTDGRVVYLRFEPEELGVIVPMDEARQILTDAWRSMGGHASTSKPIPESVAQLEVEARNGKGGETPKDDGDASIPDDVVEETILPQHVQPRRKSLPLTNSTKPTPSSAQAADTAAAPSANPDSRGMLPPPGPLSAPAVRKTGPTPPADPKLLAAQGETRVRGGKRRITPLSVSNVTPDVLSAPSREVLPLEISETVPNAAPAKRRRISNDNGAMEIDTSLGNFARNAAAEREATGENGVNGDHGNLPGDMSRLRRVGNPSTAELVPPGSKPVSHAAHLYAPSVVGLSMMVLPERGDGPGRCRIIGNDAVPLVLESRENHEGGGSAYVVTCSAGGKVKWRDYHSKSTPVTALAGVGGKFAAVGTADGMLYLYSAQSGRRIAPPVAIDSAPYMLEANIFQRTDLDDFKKSKEELWYVTVISRSAMCTVFNIKDKKLVCARSAAPLLARPLETEGTGMQDALGAKARFVREIATCEVTPYGEPILVLSDGHAFAYSADFCSWLRVADDSSPNSDFRRSIPSSGDVGILRALQSSSGLRQKGQLTLTGMGDLRRSAVESLAHLESLLESAKALGSAQDYRYYLTSYATRIASAVKDDVENCISRLREICDALIGDPSQSKDPQILGMSGRTLLEKNVLPVIGSHRHMQRFVAEYMEILRQVKQSK